MSLTVHYVLVVGVVLFLRVEVLDNDQYNHSSLPHRRLSFCTGSGTAFIVVVVVCYLLEIQRTSRTQGSNKTMMASALSK